MSMRADTPAELFPVHPVKVLLQKQFTREQAEAEAQRLSRENGPEVYYFVAVCRVRLQESESEMR
jgi:hypothetical protein